MKDEDKTKKQILSELMKLRQRVAELEAKENNHKQAEETLQKSEEKYRTLIENIPQRIFQKDKNFVYVACNNHYAQDLDITPDQVTGKTDFDFYTKELAEKYRADDKRIIESGEVVELEEDHVLPDGQKFTVQTVKAPVRNANGEINGILGIFMDITERKQSEEVFRETKDHLDNIIESSLESIIVTDNMGYITRVNKSLLQLLGYREEEIIGTHVVEFVPTQERTYESATGELLEISKEYLNAVKSKLYSNLFEKGKISVWEIYLIRKDRKVISVEENIVLLYNKSGEVTGSVGIIRDITDRKRAEEKIKETNDYLDNIIESSLDVVVASDSRGYITRVNKSFLKLTGYREKEVIGKHITEFTPYEDGTYESISGEMVEIKEFISNTLEVIEKKLFAEGKISNWETYYLCKDGKVVPVETNIAYLYNEEGDTIGSVGVNRDISERKMSERKIAEYQNELRSFASQLTLTEEKERHKFATFLHDQIGQKLFALKLKMEILSNSASSSDTVKTLDDSFKMVSQLIKDTRSLTFELSPPILHQLGLEAAIEWLTEQTYKQHSIVVDFEDDKREKTVDEAMKILLFQAVRELLTNIAKHAQSQKAKVSVKRDKTHLRICVEDDGAGFTPLGMDSSKYKNKGFGLFSIKERLDHLGGHLKITSCPGLGTQATLLAPLKGKKESLNGK